LKIDNEDTHPFGNVDRNVDVFHSIGVDKFMLVKLFLRRLKETQIDLIVCNSVLSKKTGLHEIELVYFYVDGFDILESSMKNDGIRSLVFSFVGGVQFDLFFIFDGFKLCC